MTIYPDGQTYQRFVQLRHLAYTRRLNAFELAHPAGGFCPEDGVINSRKFTNVFRLLDRGTQFVQAELLWDRTIDWPDAVFRAYLYRFTNRPEPWEAYRMAAGHYPRLEDVQDGDLRRFWTEYSRAGNPIFGNAYRMFVGQENKGKTRLQWVMDQADLLPKVINFNTMLKARVSAKNAILQDMPRTRDFMSMQVLADLQDSPWIEEGNNAYIIPGPGALVGLKALGVDKADAVHAIHHWKHFWEDQWLYLPGTETPPSLMDVQNTFCEFGKYVRWTGQPDRKPYIAKHPVTEPFIPPHLR